MRLLRVLLAVSLLTALVAVPAAAQTATPTVVAFDLVGADQQADDENLVTFRNDAPTFSDVGDGFGVFQRGVSPTIPFSLLDDSASSFPGDRFGIIGEDQRGPFFGAADTENGDNSGPVTATWVFDVSGADGPFFLNVDAGAMGDFESADRFAFGAGFGTPAAVLEAAVDEAASRIYTLDGGAAFTLADPLDLGGVPLDDDLRRVSAAVAGDGDDLTVTFTAETNGGNEAFAFDSLVITSGAPLPPVDPEPEPEPTCDAGEPTLISSVQGPGVDAPLVGDTVTVEGAVTGVYPDLELGRERSPGFAVQEEPRDVDDDPATSEGVWVAGDASRVAPGDVVQVTGVVRESFGNTEIAAGPGAVAVCDADPVDIAPTPLDLPADDAAREALEGMLVETTQDLTVTGLFTAYRFGELGVSASGILDTPTSVHEPGSPQALALEEANAENLLYIDDRGEFGNANEPWFGAAGERAGDIVEAGVVGVLYFSFGDHLLEPVGDFPPVVDVDRPVAQRLPAPELDGGNDVAAFNVRNYFNDFGDSDVLRGARDQTHFDVQSAKIVDAVVRLDAAVVGLVELENDYEDTLDGDPTTVPSIQTLVDELNAVAGPGTWDWVRVPEPLLTDEGLGGGGLGTDAIAVGIIYQPDRADPVGEAATFDIDALLGGADPDNNRWPLAQTFAVDGVDVTVVVNHFKSKGSSCDDTVVPDRFGDGVDDPQTGSCDLVREYAAERLVEWVRTKPTGARTPDTLLVGDFNAYEEEDPIEFFVSRGYVDVVEQAAGDAFTYKFDGRFGRLDSVLASPSARRLVDDAAVWQINSPEPFGYLYDNDPIDETAYASSDHDPVVVDLERPGRGRGRR